MPRFRVILGALLVASTLGAGFVATFTIEGGGPAVADSSQVARMAFRAFDDVTKTQLVCDTGAVARQCTIVGDDPFSVDVIAETPPPLGFVAYRIDVSYDPQLTFVNQAGTSENVWPNCNTALATEQKGVATYELICSTGGSQNIFYTGALANLHFSCPAAGGDLQIDLVGGTTISSSRYLAGGIVTTYFLKSTNKGGSPVADAIEIECLVDTDDDGIADVVEKLYPCMDQTVFDTHLDGDGDTLSNGFELGIGTEPCVTDTDGDGIDDGNEVVGVESPEGLGTFFTDPTDPDTDQDGCQDGQEIGLQAIFGGRRNPTDFWDFYDTWTADPQNPGQYHRDGFINIDDVLGVATRFFTGGTEISVQDALTPPSSPTAYHASYDRGAQAGPNIWNSAPANGFVSIDDVAAVANQFFHGC